MLGLALEGGGARGAFEIGAYQAFSELGLRFDGVVGTSIGAVNAALIAQGDGEKAVNFWSAMTNDRIFLEKDRGFLEVINRQIDRNTFSMLHENIREARRSGGIDTSRIRSFLEEIIDAGRLLAGPVDFGVTAVSFPDFRPLQVFKKEMTPDNVVAHVLASATFAGFQKTPIGDRKYIDGGLYDSCPYNMLFDLDYEEVLAVRCCGFGVIRQPRYPDRLTVIEPSDDLGPVLNFDPETSVRNMKMGYFDAMRVMKNLPGRRYYFTGSLDGFSVFSSIPDECAAAAVRAVRVNSKLQPKRALFEEVLPAVALECRAPKSAGYGDLLLALIEHRAERLGIDRFAFYSPKELLDRTLETPPETGGHHLLPLPRPEEAVDILLSGLSL